MIFFGVTKLSTLATINCSCSARARVCACVCVSMCVCVFRLHVRYLLSRPISVDIAAIFTGYHREHHKSKLFPVMRQCAHIILRILDWTQNSTVNFQQQSPTDLPVVAYLCLPIWNTITRVTLSAPELNLNQTACKPAPLRQKEHTLI